MRIKLWIWGGLLCLTALAVVAGFRARRLYTVARDWKSEVRYLIESGGTVGAAPASETFAGEYLDAIFGNDPELLSHLKGVISKGLADDPTLNLGEVSAMIVTYRRNRDGKIEDVVATVVGGFPLGHRKPGFHKDGFFAHQMDTRLWETGNSLIGFLGRDLVPFAEAQAEQAHNELIESVMQGDIMPLAESLSRPLYFTAVFPDPKRLVPPQLRPHLQALILKGHLSQQNGSYETILLSPDAKSATYALSLIQDMRMALTVFLKARWKGAVEKTPWGEQAGSWWAKAYADMLEGFKVEKELNIIRMKSEFERVTVNASLKAIERMGRDMRQMKGSMEERLDPRLVDASMQSGKPLNYWSEAHNWGPDWPIAAPSTNAAGGAPIERPAVSQPL